MKNMKVKKSLTALGAVVALGLAAQSLAVAQSEGDPIYDPSAGYGQFDGDMAVLCAIPFASQPFLGNASDPYWNCGDATRTYYSTDGTVD